jgi:hypothetical protein
MEKLLELLRILLTEPEKTKANLINAIKSVLVLIAAEKLYKICLGKYVLINFLLPADWIKFILSGKILLCILFICISYITLFQILPLLSTPIFWLSARFFKPDEKIGLRDPFIKWILRSFRLININDHDGIYMSMKYTDVLKKLVKIFIEKETRQEVIDIHETLVSEIGHTYFVFGIVYFFILKDLHIPLVNTLVILGFVFTVILYLTINFSIRLMDNMATELNSVIELTFYQETMQRLMKEQGFIVSKENKRFDGKWEAILEEKEIHIKFYLGNKFIDNVTTQKIIKSTKNLPGQLVLFTKSEVLSGVSN